MVLATDGEPNNCNPNSVATVAARAKQGYDNKPSVKTFVIGVGSSLTSLNQIAASGGTTKALIVDTASNPGQQFLDALNQIRGSVGCILKIPQPKSGTPDPGSVNVAFTPGRRPAADPPADQSGDESGCQGDKKWYYDDPQNPDAHRPVSGGLRPDLEYQGQDGRGHRLHDSRAVGRRGGGLALERVPGAYAIPRFFRIRAIGSSRFGWNGAPVICSMASM